MDMGLDFGHLEERKMEIQDLRRHWGNDFVSYRYVAIRK